MGLNNLARPYARAAFEYALAKQQLQIWLQQLNHLSMLIKNSAFAALLHDPKISKEKLLAFVIIVLEEKNLPPGFKNFLRLLVEKHRLTLAPTIAQLFTEDCANQEKIISVQVESVLPLDAAEQEQISKMLKKKFSRNVQLHYELNPDLIGGVLIRAGDTVMDGSVRGQLNRMRNQLGLR